MEEEKHNSLDVLSGMQKGHSPGDFGDQEIKRKEKEDPSKSGFKPIYMWIILAVIVLGIVGYFVYDYMNAAADKSLEEQDPLLEIIRDDYYIYNNYEFRQDSNGLWHTEVYNPVNNDIYEIALHFGPKDLQDIPLNRKTKDLLVYSLNYTPVEGNLAQRDGSLFLLLDPYIESAKLSLAYFEAQNTLVDVFNLNVGPAFTSFHEQRPEVPVRTCGETDEPIIYLKWEEPAQIQMTSESCIIVQGTEYELIRAVDRLLLYYYNIME